MNSLYERDEKCISSLQKLRFFPLAVTGGEGCYLIDEQKRKLLDFSGAWGAASLGYSPLVIQEAVCDCLASMPGASILSAVNDRAVLLAGRLKDLIPGDKNRRVWFGHSGSDANETVVRAVAVATGKSGIISFDGAYHGGTAGSMSISSHSSQERFEKASDLLLLPYPNAYRPYKDDVSGDAVLKLLEHRFNTDLPPSQIGALFFEPIQSDGGLVIPPSGFLKKLADICRQHDILVVSDEVKVGVGRTGKFSAFEHENVIPDFVVMGKGLGGGLPISAVIGPSKIMDISSAFAMQTLHGNPVCASAALAVLETVKSQSLISRSHQVGVYLMEKLQRLAKRQSLIGDVRGRGLIVGVELVKDQKTKEPATTEAAKVVYRAFELGMVIYYVGKNSNVLELTPPLILSTDHVDDAVQILDQAIDDVAHGRVSDKSLEGFEGW